MRQSLNTSTMVSTLVPTKLAASNPNTLQSAPRCGRASEGCTSTAGGGGGLRRRLLRKLCAGRQGTESLWGQG